MSGPKTQMIPQMPIMRFWTGCKHARLMMEVLPSSFLGPVAGRMTKCGDKPATQLSEQLEALTDTRDWLCRTQGIIGVAWSEMAIKHCLMAPRTTGIGGMQWAQGTHIMVAFRARVVRSFKGQSCTSIVYSHHRWRQRRQPLRQRSLATRQLHALGYLSETASSRSGSGELDPQTMNIYPSLMRVERQHKSSKAMAQFLRTKIKHGPHGTDQLVHHKAFG